MMTPLCPCCGNPPRCDCHTAQSPQSRRIAELEAELAEERRADAEVQTIIGKYMADAERLEAELAEEQARLDWLEAEAKYPGGILLHDGNEPCHRGVCLLGQGLRTVIDRMRQNAWLA